MEENCGWYKMTKSKHSLKITSSTGVPYTVPLYTSLNDMKNNPNGKKGHPIKIGNETLYFPIGNTNDVEATAGRVTLLEDGKTYAILKTGTPSYTQGLITVPNNKANNSSVTETLVVPAGVTRVRIAMCAAGYKRSSYTYDDGEHDQIAYKYVNGETTTIKSSDKKINIDVKTVGGRQTFQYGCKASFSLEKRSSGATLSNFYGCPLYDSVKGEGIGNNSYVYPPNNYYYTGYINVTPGQKITCTVGGKCGQSNSSFCGFILYAYGVGIEK